MARLAALVALHAAPYSYRRCVDRALAAGASVDEMLDTLKVVAPTVGLVRVVSAAPEMALALGYDIDSALESLDDPLAGDTSVPGGDGPTRERQRRSHGHRPPWSTALADVGRQRAPAHASAHAAPPALARRRPLPGIEQRAPLPLLARGPGDDGTVRSQEGLPGDERSRPRRADTGPPLGDGQRRGPTGCDGGRFGSI